MGRIKLLDESTINKIAAGEVIERPSSVVKELVENSLDADASAITISVEDGGKRSISVRDDGSGMSKEDAEFAFQRHATSKISGLDDLQKLASFGFRGEALSSIASVSDVTLKTREHGSSEGVEVKVVGGRPQHIAPVGCPPGTEVSVENLFANVPARKKSMKSKNVELAHCTEVVVSYILCRPGLSFSFLSDGETEIFHVPAEGMKGSLSIAFGPKIASNILFGDSEVDGARVEVHLGSLEHTRSSLSDLKLFVNDRPVRSPRMAAAVLSGYGSRLMKDRYPVGVVRLFIDSSAVDVNVHPAKREVRFDDEAPVANLLRQAVEKALSGQDLTVRFGMTRFADSFETSHGLSSSEAVKAVQSTLKVAEESSPGEAGPLIVPLAQIMNTYILAESSGNLLLIDQHAASERIVYEGVLESIESGREISQRLLTPIVVNLTGTERRVLEEYRETLHKAGFDLEPFGKNAFALRSLPTVLGVAQGESALRNILGDLAKMAPSRKLGLDVIWRVACHTAVRAGDPLSHGQMRTLVAELLRTKSPYTCEHGRPTMIILSPEDLEKLFKRRT